ncbi:hypothetical protein DLAC_04879 [Tieghemostelium lacteum]|uniref:Peptidase A1 domain-containing protein n=1 Tax=Tieghemostelium lacteum TaxID=361077 RepID=A0A151ZJ96_TIELA|nr:hypothetical protein DLAC_04879 [Tieghemostelium lacteum]|eukprot:KYQ93985.1 hypothetical protein DLAC_04879 [Tieghemostelium lacteum]
MNGDPIEIRTNVYVAGIKQEVVVDSGSIILVVPSSICTTCKQKKPYYHPSKSMSYVDCDSDNCKLPTSKCKFFRESGKDTCSIEIKYLDQTRIEAVMVNDQFSFGENSEQVVVPFGAITSQVGGHPLKYGILGMGNTCETCPTTPLDQIFKETNITRSFALWLDSGYSGVLTLGDLDPEYCSGSLKYTPMVNIEKIHYGVLPKSAKVVNEKTGKGLVLTSKDFGDTIVDTGSSYTLLASDGFNALVTFLGKFCSEELCGGKNSFLDGYCYNYPEDYFEDFPSIKFTMLGEAEITISPNDYIVNSLQNGVTFKCFGIRESPLNNKSIIGLSWLRNSYVIFDKEHNRIGFGKKKSTYNQSKFIRININPDVNYISQNSSTINHHVETSKSLEICKIRELQPLDGNQFELNLSNSLTFDNCSLDSKPKSTVNIKNSIMKTKFSKIEGECKFEFDQEKQFSWISNNGTEYSFYQATIKNLSHQKMSNIILSTMDDIGFTLSMSKEYHNNTHQSTITLPNTSDVISPDETYRWLFMTKSKSPLSFSIVSGGVCSK